MLCLVHRGLRTHLQIPAAAKAGHEVHLSSLQPTPFLFLDLGVCLWTGFDSLACCISNAIILPLEFQYIFTHIQPAQVEADDIGGAVEVLQDGINTFEPVFPHRSVQAWHSRPTCSQFSYLPSNPKNASIK